MSYATWPEHFTHTIRSEEIVHVVHQRRWAFYRVGVPQLKKVYIFNTSYSCFFKKKTKDKWSRGLSLFRQNSVQGPTGWLHRGQDAHRTRVDQARVRSQTEKNFRSNRRGANVYQRAGRGRVTGYGFSGWRSCEELSLRHFFPFLKKNVTCKLYK